MFDALLTTAKTTWVSFLGWAMTALLYFLPIRDLIYAIGAVFAFNFLCGYVAGMLVQKEQFDIKKGLWAFAEMAFYMLFLILLFTLGDWIQKEDWLITSVQIATYAWIVFYSINILKNLKRLFPNSKPISFLFYFLSLEFVKLVPYIRDFENQNKTKENETN